MFGRTPTLDQLLFVSTNVHHIRRMTDRVREYWDRDQAERRAIQLLLDCLDPEQRGMFIHYGCFLVKLKHRYFRITFEEGINVCELDRDGVPMQVFCINSASDSPLADSILAKKLLLEAAPGKFFRIANHLGAIEPGL